MSFSNLKKKFQKSFKEQEEKVRHKSIEQENSLMIFAKFIGLKSKIELEYSNSLGGILRSLELAKVEGMEVVESSLNIEEQMHATNSKNLTHCAEDFQSLLLNHRTKALMSSNHLVKQQHCILQLLRKCELLEKSFKRSRIQFEGNLNKLSRKKTVFQKVKMTLQRNSSSSSLSSHIVGDSWKERNVLEKSCSKYLITLTEAYTRTLLLEKIDLKKIDESINDAFLNIVQTYLSICVKSTNKMKKDVNNSKVYAEDKLVLENNLQNDLLSKLDEIYNYYFTFCFKSQSNDLVEQLKVLQNDLSFEELKTNDKIKTSHTEKLNWRQLELQVETRVLNIQKMLVMGEILPSDIEKVAEDGNL
eukprot:NODE_409_length_9212_cov_0.585537.p1 type:complete len:360 gc:universal NODE_409_length_9212_cov_0.585537:3358-2279(-)